MNLKSLSVSLTQSRMAGYVAAVAIPMALTYATTWLNVPEFVFEHLVIVIVLGIAIPWGLGPAAVAAVVSVVTDNVLMQEPVGRPTITGNRDLLDLVLFATIAVIVSSLVTRANAARLVAQQAADREKRAREERDRLIATVAHDLATPLSVLNGTVQFARIREAAEVDWSRLLDRLATASARATSLVQTLSDARALEANAPLGLTVRVHDLRAVVSPIVRMMDRLSERHPVMLTMPDRPVFVEADADRLQRVLENLVSNAIKYSPGGGPVEVSVAQQEDAAVLSVRDFGIGISRDALPRIFERSFRAPEASGYAPGLGLGLSIAAQVIAKHGGTITAAPAEDRGTRVIVRLPLARGRVHHVETDEAEPASATEPGR
jgi:signal transduction histidine kinase